MPISLRIPWHLFGVRRKAAGAEKVAAGERDLRLDFFRGLSLFFIFIDHIQENVLSWFTLHAVTFCDAAEVFIFISGYTASLVYGRSLRRNGALYAVAQVYRRVWQLYVAHIFIFVIFVAEVSYTLIAVQSPMYMEELGVGDFLNQPHLAVIRALLLDFQPPLLDILPLYIVLLGTFPIVLLLLEVNPLYPCLASALLYVLTLTRGWALHTYPDNQAWFFNPLAWQFLFVIGATFGHASVGGRTRPVVPRWLTGLAAIVAGIITFICLTWMAHWIYDPIQPLFVRLWYFTLDKTNLAPLRLFSFLALAGATLHFVRPDAAFLRARLSQAVVVCGQNSLYVFCLGIVLSVLGHFLMSEIDAGLFMQVAVNLVGIAVMIGTAELLQWFKLAGRRSPLAASE
ncbi:MAG TPA: OpgC domain-containing protein [Stellaceae bacterium]|nr:OpgC domain-containing protein [Stellaceae bacterium]